MNKKRMATMMAAALVLASSSGFSSVRPAAAEEKTKETLQHVTDANFDKEVLKSGMPVLVDFYADWCPPCRAMSPVLEEVSKDLKGKIKIVKLNTDENRKTAESYEISSIPAFFVFKKGQVVEKIIGYKKKTEMVSILNKHI